MSSDSLALFRKNLGPELARLAEEHLKHDLHQSDRDALKSAASKVSTYTSAGSVLGIGLGLFLAFRLRSGRRAVYDIFKRSEQPVAVRFPNGREEPLPNLTGAMKPSTLGDVMTYTLLGFGGLFFGGEMGLLTGTLSARRKIASDPERRDRIQRAFRNFQADALRKQADMLEHEKGASLTL